MQLPGESEADARMARSSGVIAWLPWVLSYPLRGFCLPVLLMVTLFITLGMRSSAILPAGIPDTGLPLLAITAIWALIYLQQVIRHSARGHAMPPAMSGEAAFLTSGFSPLLLPLLLATGYFALGDQRPEAAQALLLAGCFILPAHLFILATEERLLIALNPLRWLSTILQMGLPYLLAATLIAGAALALRSVSNVAGTTLLVALAGYLGFALAHLLGYIGFRRHRALGLHVEVRNPDEVNLEQQQAERLQSLLQRIELHLQKNDGAGAVRAIETEPGGPVSVRGFFEDLLRSLQSRGNVHLLAVAGRRLISVLLAENRAERALEVAESCLNRYAHFEPENPAQLETLARQALKQNFPQLFERLLKNLEQRYPGDPILITAQWLRAQHLAEQGNDEAGALARLQTVLPKLAGHPQQARIESYIRALERLAQGRSKPKAS